MNTTEENYRNITDDDSIKDILNVIAQVQLYYTPILCIFGSIGNVLSVYVFFSTKLRKLSSSYYLSALAISDTGVLISTFFTWLELIDVQGFNTSIACQTLVYLSYTCGFLSVWFVVAFTVERFIAVRYPLRRPSVCTVARARCVLAILTITSCLLHSPYLVIADITPGLDIDPTSNQTKWICGLPEKWRSLGLKLTHLDSFSTFLLPFSLIVILNTLISRTVCRLARVRRSMTYKHSGSGCHGSSTRHHHRNRGNSTTTMSSTTAASSSSSSSSSQTKVTEMLLIVSTVFICLNLPSHIFRIWVYMNENNLPERRGKNLLILGQQIALILYNTNFGINFALYCVSGQNFRRALTLLFCPRMRRRAEQTTVTVLSEYTRSIMHHHGSSTKRRKTIAINGDGTCTEGGGPMEGGDRSLIESTHLTNKTGTEATSGNRAELNDLWNETNNC